MRPDGSGVEQLTSDERVNWFPHISPDGEKIAYVSFPPGTEGHPADRDVIVRLCDTDGKNIRDLRHLFGGQGTMNVPSWSPDSTRIAFVEYPVDGRRCGVIRIGILGAAGIAPQALIRPVRRRSDMEVVAIAARSFAAATRFAEEHGIPQAYDGYPALLAAADIDLVYIALPPSEHVSWSIAALEAGKDVLCEKPISMDAAEARRAASVAERTGRHLIEAFHDHYHPLTAALREVVDSGALGSIVSIDAVVHGRQSLTRRRRSGTSRSWAAVRSWTWDATRCTGCVSSRAPNPS